MPRLSFAIQFSLQINNRLIDGWVYANSSPVGVGCTKPKRREMYGDSMNFEQKEGRSQDKYTQYT